VRPQKGDQHTITRKNGEREDEHRLGVAHAVVRSLSPACGAETSQARSGRVGVRGTLHEPCSRREPLTPTLSP